MRFYNNERRHLAIGMLPPIVYEQTLKATPKQANRVHFFGETPPGMIMRLHLQSVAAFRSSCSPPVLGRKLRSRRTYREKEALIHPMKRRR
jgi:hypothetical protein